MAAVIAKNQTTQKTWVVNPAFLQEIKESHPEFWHAQHAVRQVCESQETPFRLVGKLVRLLNELRDLMALQFALEEAYGYIEVPTEVDPAEATRADKAVAQHCSLYLHLSELIEKAEELQYRGAAAAQVQDLVLETQRFDERLRAHEQLEAAEIDSSLGAR